MALRQLVEAAFFLESIEGLEDTGLIHKNQE